MVGFETTCFLLFSLALLSLLETAGCSSDGFFMIIILSVTEEVARHGEW